MTRFARERRVFFFEEPLFDSDAPSLEITSDRQNLYVCVPHLPSTLTPPGAVHALRRLLHDLLNTFTLDNPVLWYYTPMAIEFSREISASAVVFDCMDELSAFRGAPAELVEREAELLHRADVVFTGGYSLYESKRKHHRRVFPFPSSVDVPHFNRARIEKREPDDQQPIPHPRLGFFGVIDERMDLPLIEAIATERPEWHIVLLGPVVKIDESTLPRRRNIHYLGMKKYDQLPAYLSGWDVALLPFARNDSTRFISPTKTPEYLAAGCPVVATPLRDVISPYGERELVAIASSPREFILSIERALGKPPRGWRNRVDRFLSRMSWDQTWSEMRNLVDEVVSLRSTRSLPTAAAAPSPFIDTARLRPAARSV